MKEVTVVEPKISRVLVQEGVDYIHYQTTDMENIPILMDDKFTMTIHNQTVPIIRTTEVHRRLTDEIIPVEVKQDTFVAITKEFEEAVDKPVNALLNKVEECVQREQELLKQLDYETSRCGFLQTKIDYWKGQLKEERQKSIFRIIFERIFKEKAYPN